MGHFCVENAPGKRRCCYSCLGDCFKLRFFCQLSSWLAHCDLKKAPVDKHGALCIPPRAGVLLQYPEFLISRLLLLAKESDGERGLTLELCLPSPC